MDGMTYNKVLEEFASVFGASGKILTEKKRIQEGKVLSITTSEE